MHTYYTHTTPSRVHHSLRHSSALYQSSNRHHDSKIDIQCAYTNSSYKQIQLDSLQYSIIYMLYIHRYILYMEILHIQPEAYLRRKGPACMHKYTYIKQTYKLTCIRRCPYILYNMSQIKSINAMLGLDLVRGRGKQLVRVQIGHHMRAVAYEGLYPLVDENSISLADWPTRARWHRNR